MQVIKNLNITIIKDILTKTEDFTPIYPLNIYRTHKIKGSVEKLYKIIDFSWNFFPWYCISKTDPKRFTDT